jgi:hypothetical protein
LCMIFYFLRVICAADKLGTKDIAIRSRMDVGIPQTRWGAIP